MEEFIKVEDIYDKNLNFLLGSGASYGLFPTLALKILDDEGKPHTVETLATSFGENDPRFTLVFMHYYSTREERGQVLLLAICSLVDAAQCGTVHRAGGFTAALRPGGVARRFGHFSRKPSATRLAPRGRPVHQRVGVGGLRCRHGTAGGRRLRRPHP